MENIIEQSTDDLLLKLKKRARQELVQDEAAYGGLIDELLNEKLEWGGSGRRGYSRTEGCSFQSLA
jgi:hypothetical protein